MQGIQDIVVDGILRIVLSDKGDQSDRCIHLQHPDYIYTEKLRSDLPDCLNENSRIVVVSDTHDSHHKIGKLPSCDLLVHCGDIMMTGKHFSHKNCVRKLSGFNDWLLSCDANHRIVLGGNHDQFLEKIGPRSAQELLSNATYLHNSSFQWGGLSIWGTPLSNGKSPNRAFQSKEFLRETIEAMPKQVDILITHGLCEEITSSIDHKIHIWGHSHNSYGIRYPGDAVRVHSQLFPITSLSVCVPIMNGRFKLRNLPVVLDIPKDKRKLSEIPTSADMAGHTYAARSEKRSGRYGVQYVDSPVVVDSSTAALHTAPVVVKPVVHSQRGGFSWFGWFSNNRVQPTIN